MHRVADVATLRDSTSLGFRVQLADFRHNCDSNRELLILEKWGNSPRRWTKTSERILVKAADTRLSGAELAIGALAFQFKMNCEQNIPRHFGPRTPGDKLFSHLHVGAAETKSVECMAKHFRKINMRSYLNIAKIVPPLSSEF
jgi:hypothetical protein